jgi:hypothetical protein
LKKYFILLIFISILASISAVSADDLGFTLPMIDSKTVSDGNVVKTKTTTYVIVNVNQKITYGAKTSGTNGIVWNFGDKTGSVNAKVNKYNQSFISHRYNKVGTYTIQADTYNDWVNFPQEFIKVKVVSYPDLYFKNISINTDKYNRITALNVVIGNKGAVKSKATYLKSGFDAKVVKKYPKLKKYFAVTKIKALNPGKITKITLKFKKALGFRNLAKIAYIIKRNEKITNNNIVYFN